MSDGTKIRRTWDSTLMSNVAYMPSWRKKLEATTPDLMKITKTGEAEAAENVNDLRPLRGALSRVIDILRTFGSILTMGSWRSPLSEERRTPRMNPDFYNQCCS